MVMGVDTKESEKCEKCGTMLDSNARHVEGPPFLIHEPKVCRDILSSQLASTKRRLAIAMESLEDIYDHFTGLAAETAAKSIAAVHAEDGG